MMDTTAIHRLAGVLTAAEVRRRPTCRIDAMAPSDDCALAAQFALGDVAAVERVVELHQQQLTRLVERLLGWADTATADDLVQEVFVRAIESRHRFNGHATLKTWLTRIAINECRAYGRKQRRRQTLLQIWSKSQRPRYSPPADETTDQREAARQVREAITRLPAKEREVVVLFYLEELSTAEVADALSITPGAVATRLSRAREKLKKMLDATLIETRTD